jgi:dsDNA-specific endonuclease/ATPase MutS2
MRPMFWLFATLALVAVLAFLGPRLFRARPAVDPAPDDDSGPDPDYELEIGDELDLHGVPPAEVDGLVDAFIEVSLERGRRQVRIVHGKGIGWMRQRVRERLASTPGIASFGDAAAPGSGWGATEVLLTPPVAPTSPPD